MEEVREDTSDRGRGRGSGTTNQADCLITSCIPHLSPILLPDPPAPPWSLTTGGSPWQPDRVPNT